MQARKCKQSASKCKQVLTLVLSWYEWASSSGRPLALGLSLPLLPLPGFDDFLAYGALPKPSFGNPRMVPVTLFWFDSTRSSSDIGMGV